jgi:hypothetical protein
VANITYRHVPAFLYIAVAMPKDVRCLPVSAASVDSQFAAGATDRHWRMYGAMTTGFDQRPAQRVR